MANHPLRFQLPLDGEDPNRIMHVVVRADTGLVYQQQYGGFYCHHAEVEGFLATAWAHPDAKKALDDLFLEELRGNGLQDAGRAEAVLRVGEAVKQIWYRGTGSRNAPLRLDDERTAELDEAWVPVLTPDGPGYLVWINSD